MAVVVVVVVGVVGVVTEARKRKAKSRGEGECYNVVDRLRRMRWQPLLQIRNM